MESIEGILLRHSARGMTTLALELPADFCARAARQILSWPLGKVALLTGFDVGGAPETDGPTGTYVMAKALIKLGFTPVVVSEAPVCAYFNELHIQTRTVQPDDSDDAIGRLLDSLSPVGIVSIERCGRNLHGRYCNMRGVDISKRTSPTDELVVQAARRNIPTIGVGDGGNEMGMGTYRDVIEHFVPFGGTICTAESADITLASGVSNWWGIGIAALCSLFAEKNLLPTREEETESLRLAVAAGSVDGCTKKNEMTVDRLDLETHLGILDSVNDILKKELDICAIA